MVYIDDNNVLIIDEEKYFYTLRPTDIVGFKYDYKFKRRLDDFICDIEHKFELMTVYGLILFDIYSFQYNEENNKKASVMIEWLKKSSLDRISSFV